MNAPIPDASPVRPPIGDITAAPIRPSRAIQFTPEEFTKLLTSIATNAWKVRGRIMADPKGEELREEIKKDDVKKIARHLDSIYEALTEFGIEIRDRTGEAYDYGLPDKIVSSVPKAGLTKELIVETLKPTIYWQSQIAQAGEVSRAGEFHPDALPELDMNLSAHPAPIHQIASLPPLCQCAHRFGSRWESLLIQ